jgi:hypothetical protein
MVATWPNICSCGKLYVFVVADTVATSFRSLLIVDGMIGQMTRVMLCGWHVIII